MNLDCETHAVGLSPSRGRVAYCTPRKSIPHSDSSESSILRLNRDIVPIWLFASLCSRRPVF